MKFLSQETLILSTKRVFFFFLSDYTIIRSITVDLWNLALKPRDRIDRKWMPTEHLPCSLQVERVLPFRRVQNLVSRGLRGRQSEGGKEGA